MTPRWFAPPGGGYQASGPSRRPRKAPTAPASGAPATDGLITFLREQIAADLERARIEYVCAFAGLTEHGVPARTIYRDAHAYISWQTHTLNRCRRAQADAQLKLHLLDIGLSADTLQRMARIYTSGENT